MRSTGLRRSERPATRPLHRPGSGIIPGHGAEEHLDAGIAGIRRDSVGFGPQSGTESGIKWDKVGLKWDSEGRAPALFDRGSDGADADGCSRQDEERPLILSSPVVARLLLHVMARLSHGRPALCTAPCSGESSGASARRLRDKKKLERDRERWVCFGAP